VASRAWLISAPRCRSERISVLYTGRSIPLFVKGEC
jgi:hypothetical protein